MSQDASARPRQGIGAPLPRLEDERLLRGGGRYVGDLISRTPCLHVVTLRSPHPHAILVSIDVSRARAMPGIALVLCAADIPEIRDVPIDWVPPGMDFRPEHPVLARSVVRYAGQGVVAVAAETLSAARAAADAVDVVYETLPAVLDQESALHPGAPLVHDDAGTNQLYSYRRSKGDVTAAFKKADHVIERRFVNSRVAPSALETRAVLSHYDPASGTLVHHSSSQLPHSHGRSLAHCLNMPLDRLRFMVPDVGGGFGAKLGFYADDVVCAVMTMRTGRPCAWVEGRAESFATTTHGRDHVQHVALAATRDGVVTAMRCRLVADIGAYGIGMGPGVPAINAGENVTGQYRIDAVDMEVVGVATHRTPTGPYRGAGHPEATFLIERALDELSVELGIDPVEIRRRNYVPTDAMPYRTFAEVPIDSGAFEDNLDLAVETSSLDRLRTWRERERLRGRLVGIGVASYSENSGFGIGKRLSKVGFNRSGFECARLVVHDDATMTLFSGLMDSGQGHGTALAQIVADVLQVRADSVRLVQGDTQAVPIGAGTFNSRSIAVGGSAAMEAALKILDKSLRLAAHRLDATVAEVTYSSGNFESAGRGSVSLSNVARQLNLGHDLPDDISPTLDETVFFQPKAMPFAQGTHVVVVEVDRETGQIALLRHVAADDCGRVINPLLVDGQIHGGAAQGLGQALMEGMWKPGDLGTRPAGFDTYAMPHATDLPSFETVHTVSPTSANPLGSKGAGEGATIGAPPALVNAVLDALRPIGVVDVEMPLTPMAVWRAIRRAEEVNA